MRLLLRRWSNNFIIYFRFILRNPCQRMDTLGAVKNKLENVCMALQSWRVRALLCNFLENRKKKKGREKYIAH